MYDLGINCGFLAAKFKFFTVAVRPQNYLLKIQVPLLFLLKKSQPLVEVCLKLTQVSSEKYR
jgi:hypothetical protein